MDKLNLFISQNLLSKSNILNYVDDYSIYSFYIKTELELNTKYSSPLRLGDNDPSFSLYESKYIKNKILFKDSASGLYGDVFDFIKELGKIPTIKQVLLQVNSDLELGLAGEGVNNFKPAILKKRPISKSPVIIEVTYRNRPNKLYTDYWKYLEIDDSILKYYYVTNPEIIHYIQEGVTTRIYPKELTIAYEILGTYKIYHPYGEKKYKFRNNFKSNFVEGAMQLKFHKNFCIITKASKECIFFRQHFDWESVAGKSETTLISKHFMLNILHKNYTKIFIWLDNDPAGIKAQNKYLTLYPWLIPIEIASYIKEKDATDIFCSAKRANKKELGLQYIKNLIENKI